MKKEQLYNLMYFTLIFGTQDTAIDKCSPDYILEKYDAFISIRGNKKTEKSIDFEQFLKWYYHRWYKEWYNESRSFTNILCFLFETTYAKNIWNATPNFVIEKFKEYIGDPEIVKDDVKLGNIVHILIRKKFEENYLNKTVNERQIKILTIL